MIIENPDDASPEGIELLKEIVGMFDGHNLTVVSNTILNVVILIILKTARTKQEAMEEANRFASAVTQIVEEEYDQFQLNNKYPTFN
jgi:hypothetical protein